MKKTILTTSLLLAMSGAYAAGNNSGTDFNIERNDAVYLNTDGTMVQADMDITVDRSIDIGKIKDDFLGKAGKLSGDINNLVLNTQINTGDNTAKVSLQGLRSNVDAGTDGDLGSASVSATALGSNLSVNIAADETFSTRETSQTYVSTDAINYESRHLSLASVQANSGNNSASVTVGAMIKTDVLANVHGSINSGSVAASAIGNNASINIGGIVD